MRDIQESARYLRPDKVAGVEALQATFVKHRYAPHFHQTLTLAYVSRGSAAFALEGQVYVAPAGRVFLIPPGAVHTGEPVSHTGYSYRVLYLDTCWLSDESEPMHLGWRRSWTVLRQPALATALSRVHREIGSGGEPLSLEEAIAAVVADLRTALAVHRDGAQPNPRHSATIRVARDYIHDHWSDDFSLGDLARTVGVTGPYLCRLFDRQLGMPPSSYRRNLRIEAARRLLAAGEAPASVAAACGFHDQAHLTRHFKRVTGSTPACYADGTTRNSTMTAR